MTIAQSTSLPDDCTPVLVSERKRHTSDFQDAWPLSPSASNVYEFSPEELVDKALKALQEAGIQLIEWKTLLYRRMGVPVILKDFHYLVPDEQLPLASKVLEEDQGLPRSIPPSLLLSTGGEIYSKATLYRVTRYTSPARAQHLVLYPSSFPSFAPSELELQPRITSDPSPLCTEVLVPTPPAVYASIIRMMQSWTHYDATRMTLESDLSELIGSRMNGLCRRVRGHGGRGAVQRPPGRLEVGNAARVVEEWRDTHQFREEERWIADALVHVVSGEWSVEDIPWADPLHRL
ncbi:hypothetical protein GY45DRAFT_1325243 [Cubamyces sp. BRFM 1775]|nr:hypothetical protein GY45DRAFT_1325243 [Cubamyces sp. BRFM 1775]